MKMPKLVGTTSFKLSALYLGLFLSSFLAIGMTVYLLTWHTLEQQLKSNVESDINRLKAEYDDGGLPELISEINEQLTSIPQNAKRFGLVDRQGRLITGDFNGFNKVEGWQTLSLEETTGKTKEESLNFKVLVILLPNQLWLAVGHDSGYIEDACEAIAQAFIWGFLLVIALGAVGGLYISRTFLKKIDRITHSTQAIIAGDLNHRLTVSKNRDELDNLAALLNRMLDKIGALIANVQQVSNDIAHDLRTPVSRLKFRLETALHSNLSRDQYNDQINSAIAEVDNILATFSALLRISQIESKSRRSGFKVVSLSEVVTSVTEALAPVAEEKGKTITSEINPDLKIQGDKELLTQLVFNLLENAIVHTPENTPITVSLKTVKGNIGLVIGDRGAGIAEKLHQKVFKHFYRLEQSRTTAGNGLGLSIVAAIVELHEGIITLDDNQPGLKVVVSLPYGK